MKKLLAVLSLALLGCTSAGLVDPNLAGRLSADATCVLALTRQGVSLQGATSQQVIDSIEAHANDPIVASSCTQLLANLLSDAQAAKDRIQSQSK